jgi:hypothetical protein
VTFCNRRSAANLCPTVSPFPENLSLYGHAARGALETEYYTGPLEMGMAGQNYRPSHAGHFIEMVPLSRSIWSACEGPQETTEAQTRLLEDDVMTVTDDGPRVQDEQEHDLKVVSFTGNISAISAGEATVFLGRCRKTCHECNRVTTS